MPYYVAIFATGTTSYPSNPSYAEIELKDISGRKAIASNSTAAIQTTDSQNWSSGRAHDGDFSTYYYTAGNPLVVSFNDGAQFVSARLYGGMTSYANYHFTSLRIYQSTTNYGATESSWPTNTKMHDGTYSSGGWTTTINLAPNVLPTVPTGLVATNSPVPSGTAPTFSWTHNDPDANPQSKYQIRFRRAD